MDRWLHNNEMKDLSRSARRLQAKAEISEAEQDPQTLWSVWRQDDNGQKYEVVRALSLEAAEARVAEFEARGHKQLFWVQKTR